MENIKRDFNKAAATWDEEPKRVKLAGDVAGSIAENIPLTSGMDVLDFGCGTGLLNRVLGSDQVNMLIIKHNMPKRGRYILLEPPI